VPGSFAVDEAEPTIGREDPAFPSRRNTAIAMQRAWLTARVHIDAFRLAPLEYLQGIMWKVRGLRVRSRNRFTALAGRSPSAYALWIARHEAAALSRRAQGGVSATKIILPVIETSRSGEGLAETLSSLRKAGCGRDPVVIGGDAPLGTVAVANWVQLGDLVRNPEVWLCPVQAGDLFAPKAMAIYAAEIERCPDAELIYADDDLIEAGVGRTSPHFKPDWNPDLFLHHDFITGSAVVRLSQEAIRRVSASGPAALIKSALEGGASPIHLPVVLHHRRERPKPVVPARPLHRVSPEPSVTAIIPTRNQAVLLRNCIEGLQRTDYRGIETIVVDNGSDEPDALSYLDSLEEKGIKVLRRPGPFNFSKLNNGAVRHAHGDLLCLLNNDVEMIDGDWLAVLVRQAVRPEIGAVGARLLYPDLTVQHAGVFTGIGGGAGHGHRYQHEEDPGYFERARLPQLVSAVTGACLVVARNKFLEVGGFDEVDFPVAFNDVDLCLKLNRQGWQSFYEPRATLIHHESKSRGSDRKRANRDRFAAELAALKRKWGTDKARDPFHHPHLSPFTEQFLISI
jgi:GT2 family glycosyltransferase